MFAQAAAHHWPTASRALDPCSLRCCLAGRSAARGLTRGLAGNGGVGCGEDCGALGHNLPGAQARRLEKRGSAPQVPVA